MTQMNVELQQVRDIVADHIRESCSYRIESEWDEDPDTGYYIEIFTEHPDLTFQYNTDRVGIIWICKPGDDIITDNGTQIVDKISLLAMRVRPSSSYENSVDPVRQRWIIAMDDPDSFKQIDKFVQSLTPRISTSQ